MTFPASSRNSSFGVPSGATLNLNARSPLNVGHQQFVRVVAALAEKEAIRRQLIIVRHRLDGRFPGLLIGQLIRSLNFRADNIGRKVRLLPHFQAELIGAGTEAVERW